MKAKLLALAGRDIVDMVKAIGFDCTVRIEIGFCYRCARFQSRFDRDAYAACIRFPGLRFAVAADAPPTAIAHSGEHIAFVQLRFKIVACQLHCRFSVVQALALVVWPNVSATTQKLIDL